MSNQVQTLNSMNVQVDSRVLKMTFKKLDLEYDYFSKNVLKKLCNGKIKNEIDIHSIERGTKTTTSVFDDFSQKLEGEYKSVDAFFAAMHNSFISGLSERNIDYSDIKEIRVDSDSMDDLENVFEITVYHDVEEDDTSYQDRIAEAKQINILVNSLQSIMIVAKELSDRKKEADKLDEEIKMLQKKRAELYN